MFVFFLFALFACLPMSNLAFVLLPKYVTYCLRIFPPCFLLSTDCFLFAHLLCVIPSRRGLNAQINGDDDDMNIDAICKIKLIQKVSTNYSSDTKVPVESCMRKIYQK